MKDYKQPSIEEVKLLKEDIMSNSLFFDDQGVEELGEGETPPSP